MSGSVLDFILAFFTEPTLGLPILFTGWAALAWVLWSPAASERRPAVLRRSWFPSDADLASYVYYALSDRRYSRILGAATARLDEAVHARHGRGLAALPLTVWGAERAGIPEAPELRGVGRALNEARASALARESRFFVQWHFWRTPEDDEARFLSRVDGALAESADWTHRLEATP